ncbi:MAG: hypothetical protein M1383_03835 [Patescibacteria group bacterium]|nr:hypothetical protein [Patescibacteria group bacterium]
MIHKRYLFVYGNPLKLSADISNERKEKESFGIKGEDEQWEAFPEDMPIPRTWWRKWLKIN